jgi:hypothetical protein
VADRRSWGERPADTHDAVELAREMLTKEPQMVPVCGHRYLPAGRGTSGHAGLSIVGTDNIVYGYHLADYISHEFGPQPPTHVSRPMSADHPGPSPT